MNQTQKYLNSFKLLDDFYKNNKITFQMDIEMFSKKMEPFIILVNGWSCVLGKLVGKCNNYKIRKNIVNNLFDENSGPYTHVETFYLFLNECKNSPDSIDLHSMNDEISRLFKQYDTPTHIVLNYLTALTEYVEKKSFEDSCQFLGAIEYVYHIISKDINNYYMMQKGNTPNYHYSVHEILDTKHASELFDCIDSADSIDSIDTTNDNFIKGAQWIVNAINELLNC